MIQGSGGLRKIRVGIGARGKSGGARVIYYWAVRNNLILLLFVYPKNVAETLSPTQTSRLAKLVETEFEKEGPPKMKTSKMTATMFEELLESVREGGAILKGKKKPSRRFVVGAPSVRAIRERTSLTQSEFAHLIGVSVKTLQNWEQDRRRPTGPAAALLRIIAQEPKLAVEAIHRT